MQQTEIESVNGYPVLAQRPGWSKSEGSHATVVVLCWRPRNKYDPFITWHLVLSEPEQPNYAINGNYFSNLEAAVNDFKLRAPRRS